MSSIPPDDLKILENCAIDIAKKNRVLGVCIYGSKVAGYSRPDSDYDIIIVLEDYSYGVKYVYRSESKVKVSALVVDHKSLVRDARHGFLGEFVIGRLLHVYESIYNHGLFQMLETVYKKRIILEEIQELAKTTNILCTEISFPLEFVMFSKIKRRNALYPNASYSYFKIYAGENASRNVQFALRGYKQALKEILNDDKELFILRHSDNLLRISEKRVLIRGTRKLASVRLVKKLHELSSYFIHAYAGRKMFHYVLKETESKIKRYRTDPVRLPSFMSSPIQSYCKLPEGILIFTAKEWLDMIAHSIGFQRYIVSDKHRLGNYYSRTFSYTLTDIDRNEKKIIVVKEFTKSKGIKWAALSLWTSPVKTFKVDPLFRLGTEYKALRYLRSLGINTPTIKSVVLGKNLLVTEYIEGKTLADVIRKMLNENRLEGLNWIKFAAELIAKIHADKSTLGNSKPKNIIVNKDFLCFTDVEQFGFKSGDIVWDIVQFICWGLKGTGNTHVASQIITEFLDSYSNETTIEHIKKLAKSRRYIESFYPVLSPQVARILKNEIKNFAVQA